MAEGFVSKFLIFNKVQCLHRCNSASQIFIKCTIKIVDEINSIIEVKITYTMHYNFAQYLPMLLTPVEDDDTDC